MFYFYLKKSIFINLDSRELFLLNRRGRKRGLTGIEGRKRDINRAGDPKSEEEKFLSAIVKFSKKREKISPGAEGASSSLPGN